MFKKLANGIVISNEPFSCAFFNKKTLVKLEKYIQNKSWKKESGGLLLGYRHSNHFEITFITTPKLFDKNQRFFFERRDSLHLKILQKLKTKDENISYLGEWHTHPEEIPSPSCIDISQWKICRKNSSEALLFFIFGTRDFYTELYF